MIHCRKTSLACHCFILLEWWVELRTWWWTPCLSISFSPCENSTDTGSTGLVPSTFGTLSWKISQWFLRLDLLCCIHFKKHWSNYVVALFAAICPCLLYIMFVTLHDNSISVKDFHLQNLVNWGKIQKEARQQGRIDISHSIVSAQRALRPCEPLPHLFALRCGSRYMRYCQTTAGDIASPYGVQWLISIKY